MAGKLKGPGSLESVHSVCNCEQTWNHLMQNGCLVVGASWAILYTGIPSILGQKLNVSSKHRKLVQAVLTVRLNEVHGEKNPKESW